MREAGQEGGRQTKQNEKSKVQVEADASAEENMPKEETEDKEKKKKKPDRSSCIRKAMDASIVEWCRANGVPLEQEAGHFRHGEIESLVMKGRWWVRRSKNKGALERYEKGGLIQFLEEYEGIGIEEALRKVLAHVAPHDVLPEWKPGMDRSGTRAALSKRIDKARSRGPVRGGKKA